MGRRPVRNLPRRGRPAVLRARLRRCRSQPLRADDPPRQPEPLGPARCTHDPPQRGRRPRPTAPPHGAADRARRLADGLIRRGFDIAYSYRKRSDAPFPHAIVNTQLFLDYAGAGSRFDYRLIPITVNCYGQHASARRGGLARFAAIADERLDPSGPTPARCFALGRAVAQAFGDTNLRVALVASSSWSHAFLTDKTWHITPDTAADRRLD